MQRLARGDVGHDAQPSFVTITRIALALSLAFLIASPLRAQVDPDALVELPLNEGSGTLAGDVSGSGNDGTLVNGPVFEANTGDGSAFAVRFDGVDDFVDLGVLDVNGPGLTLAARFNADSFPGPSSDPRLISKSSGTAGSDHVFMLGTIRTGGVMRLRARVRVGGSTKTLIASSGDLTTGVWRHAALTYDGAVLLLYLDAIEVGSTPLSGAVDADPLIPVTVGSQPPGAGLRFFDGLLDDVRILQRALSAGELMSIVGGAGRPVATDDAYVASEDTPLIVGGVAGVLANDTDPELDPLQAVLEGDVSNGVLNLNADGSFDYTPTPNFNGVDTFTYRAHDGSLYSDPATVTITVIAVNDPPLATDDTYETSPNTALTVNSALGVLANDTDPDWDVLQAVLVDNVSSGVLNLNADGSFDYSPTPNFSGADSFTYRANDGLLLSNLATVTITVDAINDAPRIVTGVIAFTKQVIDATVGQTHAVVAADFDQDGDVDVVATDYVDGSVLWYENDGANGFTSRVLDANLAGAYPVHVGDVDGDGDADVLAGGYIADTVAWFENDGSGGFTRRDVDTAADGIHSIVTGDMDLDGDIDLLTTNQDAGTVTWYENDGTNGFTRHTIDHLAAGAKRAEFADIDNDGDPDVVSASFFVDEIAWHENDGNQVFTKRIVDTTASGAYYASPADVDGDGDIDVLSASRSDNTIALYRNNGLGSFTSQTIDTSAAGARTVIPVDLDLDGDLDALATSVGDDTVAWYENDGAGGYSPHAVDVAADGAYGVFAIDMDSDGDVDVLSASRDANAVAVHYQIKAHSASLDQGGTLIIDSSLLSTIDADDGPSDLIYSITSAPVFGDLLLDGIPMSVGGGFTQDDINNDRVSYVHGGVDTSPDGFSFTVADGGENGVRPGAGTFAFIIPVPAAALVHLPMDEGVGTLVADYSGSGNDGTLVNGPVFEADTGDGSAFAVRFDGVDDFVDLGPLDVTGSGLTLAIRFNADSFPGPSGDPRLISKASGTAGNDHVFMLGTIRTGGVIRLRARVRNGGSTTTLIADSGNLATGVWRHAALTYDGAALLLYLDAIEVGRTLVGGAVDVDPLIPVTVGSQPPGAGSRFFDGLLDDVRILQRALTASEITMVYVVSAEPPAAPTDLSATAVSPTEIDLVWTDNSDNEDGFEIERSETGPGGPFNYLATAGANTTIYTDTGLIPETQYCYRVLAVNAAGWSGYSNVSCATGLPLPACSLTVNGVGCGSVMVEPDLPFYNCGDVVTLTASSCVCWVFDGWSGDLVGSLNPDTLTLTGDMVVTATFVEDLADYTLTVNGVGNGSVDVTPAPPYYCGDVATLTANPDPGWQFCGWSGDLIGLTNPETLAITGNANVTACFEEVPPYLLFEDFEAYACGSDPLDWYDTTSGNSMVQDDSLFGVLCLGSGSVFGTTSGLTNIHSHYVGASSATWFGYRYTGRLMVDVPGGGIGMTFLSDYPNTDTYYRLRCYWGNALHISPHGTGISGGVTGTGVVPAAGVWYEFLIEVEDAGTETQIRAKVWEATTTEPAAWQVDCYDAGAGRLTAGTVGVWSMGPGGKYWDDLRVDAVSSQPPGPGDSIRDARTEPAMRPSTSRGPASEHATRPRPTPAS